jgi:hypothetical protein
MKEEIFWVCMGSEHTLKRRESNWRLRRPLAVARRRRHVRVDEGR